MNRWKGLLGSAAAVGAGYLVLGGAGYVFLAVARRVFDDDARYSALASVYLLVNIVGPGLFAAVEQETSRHVSVRLARGSGTATVVRRLGLLSALLFGGIAVLVAALSPVLLHRVLNSDGLLLAGLFAASAGYAVVSVTRGTFGGRRLFGVYGASVGTEGLVRLVGCAGLAAAGVAVTGPYGLLFCLAPLVAVLVTGRWFRLEADGTAVAGPEEPLPVLARSLGLLTVAWGLSLAIANAAPVVVTALVPDGRAGDAAAAGFASAVVLARIPLFVFQGAQSLVLPSFARAAAHGDPAELRRAVRPALLLALGLGAAAVLVSAVAGGWIGRIAFGPRFTAGNALVAVLMLGTVAVMAVQIVQPALLALGRHRTVAAGWVAGALVFGACFALPFTPVDDAVVAQLASAAVTVGILGTVLAAVLRDRAGTPQSPLQESNHVERTGA